MHTGERPQSQHSLKQTPPEDCCIRSNPGSFNLMTKPWGNAFAALPSCKVVIFPPKQDPAVKMPVCIVDAKIERVLPVHLGLAQGHCVL